MDKLNLKHRPTLLCDYLQPAMDMGLIEMTQPDSPKSPTQKYRLAAKGIGIKKSCNFLIYTSYGRAWNRFTHHLQSNGE